MQKHIYKNIKQAWINSIKTSDDYEHKTIEWSSIIKNNYTSFCDKYFAIGYNSINFEIEYIEGDYENVLGYTKAELNTNLLTDIIDENDLPFVTKFEKFAMLFFCDLIEKDQQNYTYKYDAKYKKKDGNYIRLKKEIMLVPTSENPLILNLVEIYTDISLLKKEGNPSLCFFNSDKKKKHSDLERVTISPSEKNVLKLLIEGYSSKLIAEKLHLSKETVDTHRKNMIKKNNVSNTSQLIAYSLINKLITI